MNPFTESTVARALPKDHRDHCWADFDIDAPSQRSDPAHRLLSGQALESDMARSGLMPDKIRSEPVSSTRKSSGIKAIPVRGKSFWAALGVGLGLLFSAGTATLTSPAALTGAVAIAATLMPRDAQAIDLNQATAQDLQAINGIGPKTASMIVAERTRGGNFSSLSDLSDRVRGIGPKKATALQAAGLNVTSASQAGAKPASSASKKTGKPSRQ